MLCSNLDVYYELFIISDPTDIVLLYLYNYLSIGHQTNRVYIFSSSCTVSYTDHEVSSSFFRQQALGFASLTGRLGGMIGPFMMPLVSHV